MMDSGKFDRLTEALIAARFQKHVAKTLAYILTSNQRGRSVEMQRATSLKQPEVSVAIKQLRKRGWITRLDIKKKGKGRPVHEYRLKLPPKQILIELEAAERRRLAEIKKNIRLMGNIIKTL